MLKRKEFAENRSRAFLEMARLEIWHPPRQTPLQSRDTDHSSMLDVDVHS